MSPPEFPLHNASPRATRSHSVSSDRPSLTGFGGLLSPPVSTSPEPAFIAASAASQIVTNDHDSQADAWFDQNGIEPSGETALVSPPALKLVNCFLDQLLFNFLSISRSTSLASFRPAVSEVLKPKLARDAISGADQELHEYLGGGEDEELLAFHNGLEPGGDWDLELVWKRTRLRCMVYSSLGDMEEEDEDFYTEQEQLDGPSGSNNRFSNNPGVVSPAVAIFLTSILEFMGEQVLVVAGQAAYHRLRGKREREEREGITSEVDIAERVVVEESDMERVALDRTLGRLWRGWKKRIRSPTTSISMARSFSPESVRSQPQTSSITEADNIEEGSEVPSIAAVAELAEHEYAAGIPLPISTDDVREIEIPGLAQQSDVEDEQDSGVGEAIHPLQRPKSLTIFTSHTREEMLTVTSLKLHTPIFSISKSRKRSHSLPSPAPTLYTSPSAKRPKTGTDKSGDHEDMVEDVDVDEEAHKDESKTQEPGQDEPRREIAETDETKGLLAGVVTGAATLGIAAVAGVAAAAAGHAPQTAWGQKEEIDAEEEEEPQILTSSRVSIGGRVSPDDPKAPSRQSSVRSPSVHSLRLIDVASPKSPARSRHGSVDAYDYASGRPTVVSQPSSIHPPIDSATPRVASPVSRAANTSPLARVGSSMSSRHPRNSAGGSIMEEKEVNETESAPMTAVPADLAAAAAVQGVDVEASPTSQQYASEPSNRDATPPASNFVLSTPPGVQDARGNASTNLNDQQPAQLATNLGVSSKALGLDNGVPPLTPLREMMEGAPDTSDEASSTAPSNDAHSISEHVVNGHSPSVSGSSLIPNQRATDHARSVRGQNAPVPRTSPPRPSRDDQMKKDYSKTQRSIHTSGSGSGSSAISHKLKPVRTSEESPPYAVEDKSQSFEQLIRSDQTIQYTLTPQNMRDIEGAPESPRFAAPPLILNPQEGTRPPTSRSHSSSVSKYAGLHSNAPVETPKPVVKVSKPVISAPVANSGARLRTNAPQPRDARVERESMGDLAEFISSTAPPGSYDQLPPRSAPSVNGHRGMNGTARNVSGSTPRVTSATSLPRRAESSAGRSLGGRSKLQARDAVVPRGDSISDLIDFVRSGPQLDKESHRIPRTVAPFRTTMDSDQMSGAVGGKAIDASLPDPRYSQASTSVHSSVNSQSALINSSTKMNKPLPSQNLKEFDEADVMPKRKTRRVRDIYQIDFSDEEEEYEAASSRPKPIKEESLAEFLANVPPPPDSSPAPIILDTSSKSPSKLKKKNSIPSLMSRFGRNNSGPQAPPKPKSSGHESRPSGSRSTSRPPQLATHTPIAVQFTSSKSATYEPARGTGSNYVSQLDTARNKVAQKSYQPRDAVVSTVRTNDLAAFLRSDPPSSMSTKPQAFTSTLQKEEASTFQRVFGRKKVH